MNDVGAVRPPVFVTLDQSLGQLRLDPSRGASAVAGVDLYPGAVAAMQELASLGSSIDVLVPEADEDGGAAALAISLPGVASVRSAAAFSATLARLAGDAAAPESPGIFVAADRVQRGEAARLGFTPVPHISLVNAAIENEPLSFVHIVGSRRELERLPNLLPYHLERQPDGQWSCLGVVPRATLAQAAVRRLRLDVLPLDIGVEDPILVQLDDAGQDAVDAFAAMRVLAADGQRALVAMPSDQPTDEIPFHGAHGHFEHLAPSPELLRPAPAPETAALVAARAASFPARGQGVEVVAVERPHLRAAGMVGVPTCPGNAASFAADVDRFSGVSDPGGGPIVSRHARHPHNPRAVERLVADLTEMGYCATIHAFEHNGRTLHNVIADLPGAGVVQLVPDVREQVRTRLLAAPAADGNGHASERAAPGWLEEVAPLLDLEAFAASGRYDAWQLRGAVEQAAGLSPWQTWWLADCPLPGIGAELVIVGCHLDSTAQSDVVFQPATDPAPGADDNASGIAGVLAVARQMAALRGTLTHTVRFCFFNAEEDGLVGSKAYAKAMKVAGAPIRAVVCMDMIGFNSDLNRLFEIHAGYTDPAVRDASVPIADRVAAWAASAGTLAPAQIYRGTMRGGPTDSDRDKFDGAIGRSDHAAFHEQGYPAVAITEDFFANRPSESGSDPNPNYHSNQDTVIDAAYAADIVCAVAQAVKELAA